MGALKLVPAYKDYLWGGNRLACFYGKNGAPTPLAETWEVSLHPDGVTRLEDGRALSDFLTPLHLGKNAERFADFPLLIKLIDAAKDLSVQVHPSDAYALKNENSYGKTEMWYIVEAEAGAGIYLGFSRDVTEKEARDAIKNETFTDLLRFVPVKAGECYFIPAGTVHAIGAGCLICEIQQNSNLTYRIYDYGRRDASGALRPLHTEKAFSVMSLSPYTPPGRVFAQTALRAAWYQSLLPYGKTDGDRGDGGYGGCRFLPCLGVRIGGREDRWQAHYAWGHLFSSRG